MEKFTWLLIAFSSCCVVACGPDYVYNETQEIPNGGQWNYQDTLNFKFTITDTVSHYNFYLDIAHSDTFAFQNIYLNLHTLFPDGHRLNKLRSFDVFDAQGAAVGDCSGKKCILKTVLQENAFFSGNRRLCTDGSAKYAEQSAARYLFRGIEARKTAS